MKGSKIKYIALIAVGLWLLIIAMITPLPAMLSVSGTVWRIIIGLLGCILILFGIYSSNRKNKN